MKTENDFAAGAWVGGITTVLWYATNPLDHSRSPVLWLPLASAVALLVLGRARRQFGALRGFLVGASPIVLLPALVLCGYGAYVGGWRLYDWNEHLHRRQFVAAEWRGHRGDNTRARMAEDLMSSNLLLGAPRDRVEAMLGLGDTNLGGGECEWAYWLNTRKGWLCITSNQGRVATVRLREYRD